MEQLIPPPGLFRPPWTFVVSLGVKSAKIWIKLPPMAALPEPLCPLLKRFAEGISESEHKALAGRGYRLSKTAYSSKTLGFVNSLSSLNRNQKGFFKIWAVLWNPRSAAQLDFLCNRLGFNVFWLKSLDVSNGFLGLVWFPAGPYVLQRWLPLSFREMHVFSISHIILVPSILCSGMLFFYYFVSPPVHNSSTGLFDNIL